MALHDLKSWTVAFEPMVEGIKRFELRKNDRGYERGDRLNLREWNQDTGYTGRELLVSVTWILKEGFGLPEGYCIMSINPLAYSETHNTKQKPKVINHVTAYDMMIYTK
jgi:hypothetical protein